ncbi:hypothetical protein ACFQ05_25755 [Amycolatopsis umgeniensis]|uniref:Uncharacterized protein n=1 Tax=Amycolatopsis umgeniensis TaxID=336628 RepID=A0A841BBS4_9PSEU|nr:hypothetical protein [Amycolatopsis umgeniensis]MBB5856285.1 hypothetical protein [Amycolatopsis umgeniensis]
MPEIGTIQTAPPGASDDVVNAGVRYAEERLGRHELPMPSGEVGGQAIEFAIGALEGRVVPVRAAEQFVEQVVVAAAMREVNDEPPLTASDIRLFRDVSTWFFNSFWHE